MSQHPPPVKYPITAEILASALKHGIQPGTRSFESYLRGWYAVEPQPPRPARSQS